MPRLAREKLVSNYYHVIVQGINKEKIFITDDFKKKYLGYLKTNMIKHKITILAYCVMNNHIHILVYLDDINELSKAMMAINTKFAIYYNKQLNRCGYVYRDRYKCQCIWDREYLENCIRYIHNNPVKAKICKHPRDYIFSSYNIYANNEQDDRIIKLAFGEKNNYKNKLNLKVDTGDFLEVEDNKYENIDNVIKEYQNIDLDYPPNTYKLICDLKNRCNMKNEEIQMRLKIKRARFYRLIKKYKAKG